jgi:hypothetical protein
MKPADPLADATDLVADLFPQARWAILSGAVLTTRRTPGSDLDIVVLLPDNDPEAPHRDSLRWRDWPVELFVHDEASLNHYLAKDLPARRPSLHRMIATGVAVTGDAKEVQTRCAEVLAAGPVPLSDAEREHLRYQLTDLLDDLTHVTEPAERVVIAGVLWSTSALQMLALNNHWRGTGKWLLRELQDLDAELADRWVAAYGDPAATAAFAEHVLDQAGGPLFAGYRVAGERS